MVSRGRKDSCKGPVELFRAAGVLKTIPRKGWGKAGITNQESVADHTFRMAVIAAYLSKQMKLDSGKLVRMSLFHDLAESKIGDLTPEEKTSEKAHRMIEQRILRSLVGTLPTQEGKVLLRDCEELFQMKTREARLVWQIDKLEMGLTMKDYIRTGGKRAKLKEFDPSLFLSDELRQILEEY